MISGVPRGCSHALKDTQWLFFHAKDECLPFNYRVTCAMPLASCKEGCSARQVVCMHHSSSLSSPSRQACLQISWFLNSDVRKWSHCNLLPQCELEWKAVKALKHWRPHTPAQCAPSRPASCMSAVHVSDSCYHRTPSPPPWAHCQQFPGEAADEASDMDAHCRTAQTPSK
jgi:hypothetical protein